MQWLPDLLGFKLMILDKRRAYPVAHHSKLLAAGLPL